MDDVPVLDEGALDRLDEWGGVKLKRQMVRLYLENARTRLEQLDGGLAADGEMGDVRMAAHSLKSSAANVGLMRVSAISARIEESAADGDVTRVRDLREPLESAAREGAEALSALLPDEVE